MLYLPKEQLTEILERPTPEVISAYEATCQEFRTRFPGGEVVWRTWGAGPAAVLLHGGTGSWLHWIRTIPKLAEHYTVMVPDIPGMGDSGSPPVTAPVEALITGLADILRGALSQLVTPSAPINLVGFSFGSMVAAHMATQLGARAQRLVLVGSCGYGLSFNGVSGLEKPSPEMNEAQTRAMHRHNMCRIMFHDEANADELALAMQLHNAARMRLRTHESAASLSLANALPDVLSDVRVIWGEHDPFVPHDLPACERLLAASGAASARVELIPKAGHWVAYEAADEFNDALRNALRD